MNSSEKEAGCVLVCGAVKYVLENGDEVEQLQLVATMLHVQSKIVERKRDEAERKRYQQQMQTHGGMGGVSDGPRLSDEALKQMKMQQQQQQDMFQKTMAGAANMWNGEKEEKN